VNVCLALVAAIGAWLFVVWAWPASSYPDLEMAIQRGQVKRVKELVPQYLAELDGVMLTGSTRLAPRLAGDAQRWSTAAIERRRKAERKAAKARRKREKKKKKAYLDDVDAVARDAAASAAAAAAAAAGGDTRAPVRIATVDDLDLGGGRTPLHYAAYADQARVCTWLLEAGASVHAKKLYDERAPLHLAAGYASAKVVRLLLDAGADVNARSRNDWTPLHHAIITSNFAAVRALVAGGANIDARVTHDGGQGFTALQFAVVYADDDISLWLFFKAGADIEYETDHYDKVGSITPTFLC
jgi:hypothetical protein